MKSEDGWDPAGLLHSHGLRATPQRLAVLEVLKESFDHPTAEEVCERVRLRVPGVSSGTVYKALGELRATGEARALPVPGRMRFDFAARGPHHHQVCEICGRTEDVRLDGRSGRLWHIRSNGFRVESVEVALRGICALCQNVHKEQSRQITASNKGTNRRAV